jgi:hypothetical protein
MSSWSTWSISTRISSNDRKDSLSRGDKFDIE